MTASTGGSSAGAGAGSNTAAPDGSLAGTAVRIVRLAPADWQVHRELRLEALRNAPEAFGATYADNAAYDEATWRARLEAITYWQARRGQEPVGMVGLWEPVLELADVPDGVEPGEVVPFLIAMYVRDSSRGQGVGEELVRTLLEEARSRGHARVALDVTSTNPFATARYVRLGFTPVDDLQRSGRRGGAGATCEVTLVCDVSAPASR